MYFEKERPDRRVEAAWIGRAHFSRTYRTLYYGGRTFAHIGRGEWREVESGEHYWISGARKDGNDRHGSHPGSFPIRIDDDAREEYWREVRGQPERANERVTHG